MNIPLIIPLFFGMRGWQLIIVVLLIILLFGAKRIPALMKSLGKSVHAFKAGVAEAESEIRKPVKHDSPREKEKLNTTDAPAKDIEE